MITRTFYLTLDCSDSSTKEEVMHDIRVALETREVYPTTPQSYLSTNIRLLALRDKEEKVK